MVFCSLRGDHLTFSRLNSSNLPENLPVVNMNYSLMTYDIRTLTLTLLRMGFLGAAHGQECDKKEPLPKICHTSYNNETWQL